MLKIKKILSVVLCICMVFSVCAIGASAENKAVSVSGNETLENLEFDVPVVLVAGIGGAYFNGAQTPDPDDDKQIWGPSGDVIAEVIFKNIGKLLWYLIINDYDAVSALMGDVTDTLFGEFSCNENGIPDPDTYRDDKSTLFLDEINEMTLSLQGNMI